MEGTYDMPYKNPFLFFLACLERVGKGVSRSTHPFEIIPPPPSRKGALRAGSSINTPFRDNRRGALKRALNAMRHYYYTPFRDKQYFFLSTEIGWDFRRDADN